MTVELTPTFFIGTILSGIVAVWALAKVIIPRLVDARLKKDEDEREYQQSTGNIAIDVLRDYIREINAGRAREIDELSEVIQKNIEASQLQNEKLTEAIAENTAIVKRFGQQVENYTRSVTTLAGVIEQMRD